jgi:phenolic acid decarboxylase
MGFCTGVTEAGVFKPEFESGKIGGKKMTPQRKFDSLYGQTLRWTFTDGPVAGKTFEHTFNKDGTVVFRGVDGNEKGKSTPAKDSAVVKITNDVFAVSYLADSGYTLTVVLNLERGEMAGFASNDKQWFQQRGTFEILKESD